MRLPTRIRPRSAYDVLALVAFFISVAGGGAYAAATIGAGDIRNNAVHSNHIKDGAVKTPDLAPSSVGSRKVIDGSLLGKDVGARQLPPGAVSFDKHLNVGLPFPTAPVNGIKLQFDCDMETHSHPAISFFQTQGVDLDVSGTYSINGQLFGADSYPGGLRVGSGGTPIALNVIARFSPGGKWTSFHIRAEYRGPSKGCDFGGTIALPSN